MGQAVSTAVNEVPVPVPVSVPVSVPIKDTDWAFKGIRDNRTGLFRIELAELKNLVLANLISSKDMPYGASKAIKKENFDTSVANFPVPLYPFPGDPIWYGPYGTVDQYIARQHNPGQAGLGFDTYVHYPFKKTVECYFVRFTNDLRELNIDLIRRMYHCLELLWSMQGLINGEGNGHIIRFTAFDGQPIGMKIEGLRRMYGYYDSSRVSYYKQDRFIITEFMKLIAMMDLPPEEPIVGYFLNYSLFHPEFTILGGMQRTVLKKPHIATIVGQENGHFMWKMISGGGVQTSNLLQIEPNLGDKQKLLEMGQPLQIEPNLGDKQKLLEIEPTLTSEIIPSTDLSFPGITNSDEFIKIIQEFFNYQYEVLLFDMSDLKLSNIRVKQLELTEKALLLITDKKLYNFTKNFLYLYTVSPVEKISPVENIGGKRKSKRSKSKRNKGKSKRRKSKRNKNKYNL